MNIEAYQRRERDDAFAASTSPRESTVDHAHEPALRWSDALVTGHAAMDATHQSFISVANELVAASDADLLERLCAFEAHAVAHFNDEDQWMRSTAYPSAGCHIDEHAEVLKSVSEVIALVAQGNVALGRDLADELVRWFPEHTHHMDKSLTAWLFKLSTGGGAPLVFRRNDGAAAQARPLPAARADVAMHGTSRGS